MGAFGDVAAIGKCINSNWDASGEHIGEDPAKCGTSTTTSGGEEILIVDGLEVGELVGHWNELVRGKWGWGSVLPPRLLQDPSGCGDEQKRVW